MKKNSLREVICEITNKHLKKYKTQIFGQNLLGVGQVNNTLPKNLSEKDGVVDLPMADIAGGGIVAGSALIGKRPFYIIRYQGYNWFNMIFIVNYACKSKEIWKKPAPIFIRGIANEGCIGPVAGSTHISQFYKMPGIKIFSPITPKEYLKIYKKFCKDETVYYISEHRKTYDNQAEFKNFYRKKPKVTILLNSVIRHSAEEIKNHFMKSNIRISILHIYNLKPFKLSKQEIKQIKETSKAILICDNDYTDGIPSIISSKIMNLNKKAKIYLVGLPQKTAGHHPKVDVLPPSTKKIINKIYSVC
jgi:pyruvate/2-oxoglutarate/acetoin dehydrogenase E1 component